LKENERLSFHVCPIAANSIVLSSARQQCVTVNANPIVGDYRFGKDSYRSATFSEAEKANIVTRSNKVIQVQKRARTRDARAVIECGAIICSRNPLNIQSTVKTNAVKSISIEAGPHHS
jgi:hypothetical protein